jgi:hypothetical protein
MIAHPVPRTQLQKARPSAARTLVAGCAPRVYTQGSFDAVVTGRLCRGNTHRRTSRAAVRLEVRRFFFGEGRVMASPARNGVSKNYTYDLDALECLRELWPARKGQGHYISSLLRAERARHEERARALRQQKAERARGEVPK